MFNSNTFHLEHQTDYYERASYTWSSDSIRCFCTNSPHTRTHYLYAQECGYFQTKPPYFTERASLPSYLLLYTVSGAGVLFYEHGAYHLAPQNCFWIDCMNPHRYEPAGQSDWEFLWLHFYGTGAEGYYQDYCAGGTPVVAVQDTFLAESTLRRILSLQQKKAAHTEVLTASLITNLLTELILQKITLSDTLLPLPCEVEKTAAYIRTHYTESITLDMLSAHVNVSKYHLSRLFSQYMGVSINQFHINCRLQHAKELLRESNLSIENISFQTGIQQVSHFIALFKSREGMTPLQYRKLWG